MKKAVISAGSKQYIVSEGQTIEVELLHSDKDTVTFKPLLVIDGKDIVVGLPAVDKSTVKASIVEADVKTDKVTAIRYKAKKRVKKVHGHRQRVTKLKIDSIA